MSGGVSNRMDIRNWKLIARNCPACPTCKELLIARPADRRFMEDDNYVECLNGHVFALADPVEWDAMVEDE